MQRMNLDIINKRVSYKSPLFTSTGVDFFGPFYVIIRCTTEKSWVFLSTCLTTPTVHVQIVTSMDTCSALWKLSGLYHVGLP